MYSIAARRVNKRVCQLQPNGMFSRGTMLILARMSVHLGRATPGSCAPLAVPACVRTALVPQSAQAFQCCRELIMEERSKTAAGGEQRYDAYPQHLRDTLITVAFLLVVRQQRGC
jgi:hypothetical protein